MSFISLIFDLKTQLFGTIESNNSVAKITPIFDGHEEASSFYKRLHLRQTAFESHIYDLELGDKSIIVENDMNNPDQDKLIKKSINIMDILNYFSVEQDKDIGELPFVMTDIKEYEYIDIVNEQSPLYLQR